MIWYGFCTFWTDDWGQLSRTEHEGNGSIVGGIPCCPDCGSVGYQIEDDEWWEGVQIVEKAEPGYYKFIRGLKDTCHGPDKSVGDLWDERKGGVEKTPG
jgi:hypothetical protein